MPITKERGKGYREEQTTKLLEEKRRQLNSSLDREKDPRTKPNTGYSN